jgi:hypothetical protein
MGFCMGGNVGAAIGRVMDFIFEDETLTKRLCTTERKVNGDRPRTPNGGYKMKFSELPILVENTVRCNYEIPV